MPEHKPISKNSKLCYSPKALAQAEIVVLRCNSYYGAVTAGTKLRRSVLFIVPNTPPHLFFFFGGGARRAESITGSLRPAAEKEKDAG